MKKILLTSAGFKNPNIEKVFLEKIGKPVADLKVIYVPTAAVDDDAKAMLPVCMKYLTDAGVLLNNIFNYNLDYLLSVEDAKKYDVVYFCGGSSQHLLNSINTIGFNFVLNTLVSEGMFYIGISAGSKVAANNLENNLGILDCNITVHAAEGSPCGVVVPKSVISITDYQAVLIDDNKAEIIM